MASRGFAGFEKCYLISCLIADNTSSTGSGLLGNLILTLVPLSNDGSAGLGPSGADAGPSVIKNSIFYGNSSNGVGSFVADITYSLIEGGYSGTGNIDTNPQFLDALNNDYRLSIILQQLVLVQTVVYLQRILMVLHVRPFGI